ncbi:MAG: hypothetical protein COY75_11150 [Nitrospirae bacterium CG_4_10_14_0_8_um_filter_41_23]|nr:MAG: hypothetical protein COS27_06900 [Nitrospirae bacterium CG02_land_8_20_14_3_00_41_53]PIY85855.1 MAG: hypothetical protein COY75_11150 [Nitrospirae bacterium CG_4_10_14_0_8_um_filter_41_23]
MDIEAIRVKVKAGKYIISFSHTEKIRLRKIEAEEIEDAIYNREQGVRSAIHGEKRLLIDKST